MASKLEISERERLIDLSGRLAKEGMGVNQITRYLLEHENVKISAPSVSNFLKEYQKKCYSEEIDYTLKDNRGDISNTKVYKRVLENAKRVLEGKTVKDISEETSESYYKVYRDLTIRLPKINEELYEKVISKLNENKDSNLKNGRKI